MRLALGTVQFGLEYGIANRTGKVHDESAAQILRLARTSGIDTIDTAIAYGNSEAVLGRIGVEGMRVVTKIPALPADVSNASAWVVDSIERSLERLGVERVAAVLLHRPADLGDVHGSELRDGLDRIQSSGLALKVGVSVYGPADLEGLPDGFQPDLVQAPFNIFDRRLESSGWLERLREAGVEVHTRSTFLQGLLLMAPSQRPGWVSRWDTEFSWYDGLVEATGLSRLAVCLMVPLACAAIDRVVVGIDTADQLAQILTSVSTERVSLPPLPFTADSDLLNPGRWPDYQEEQREWNDVLSPP